MNQNKASCESQLYGGVCDICDTEQMHWCRLSDDYQSKMTLAGLLISQYRYTEALTAFEEAEKIRSDEAALYLKIAGTNLTLLRYDEAKKAYRKAIELGANEKALAYPLAVRQYLMGNYAKAAELFRKCLPCGDELKISVIYWEILSCLKSGIKSQLCGEYSSEMNVGHHTAYQLAVRVMLGEIEEAAALLEIEKANDLDFVIAAYGIAEYMKLCGRNEEGNALTQRLFEKESIWPCISYLAALSEKDR